MEGYCLKECKKKEKEKDTLNHRCVEGSEKLQTVTNTLDESETALQQQHNPLQRSWEATVKHQSSLLILSIQGHGGLESNNSTQKGPDPGIEPRTILF